MKKPVVLIALLGISYSVASAAGPSAFIAGNAGGLLSRATGFDKLSDSRLLFAFGGECGFPVSQEVSLFVKFAYVSKSGISVTSINRYNYFGQPLSTPEIVVGNVSVWQLVVNYGVLHRLLVIQGFGIEINGGFAHSIFRAYPENIAPGSTSPISPVQDHNAIGVFAGMVVMHQLSSGPLALFLETQFNQLWPSGSSGVSSYTCVNVSGGIRLCLDCR